ncbi:hypothetical protein NP233_g4381 [Leucocoprinus birnbaumii]|uniref:Protein kinase domain-containing protein n=1 Tax=Leucocoprinus birnbaumii TaxID=56174 RepID=A0AAD5VVF5_9AGAR|nr:hypothetical protein NP233_g4381 [Leucocoprinus birnbaumii]
MSATVLSGRAPFSEIVREIKVSSAISTGNKPIRPGKGCPSESLIDDATWQLLLLCWELEPASRPLSLNVHQILLSVGDHPIHPILAPALPWGPTDILNPPDLEAIKACLSPVIGSEHSPTSRVPEHLRQFLCQSIDTFSKRNAMEAAAKKLSPDDAQMFANFLDMVLDNVPVHRTDPASRLLSNLVKSTYVIPRSYHLNGIQYDPIPLSGDSYGLKVYRGRQLRMLVHVATPTTFQKYFFAFLYTWAHSSHPNLLQFHGIFWEEALESPRLCVVTPLWANRCLNDYVQDLPQQARMPLILDIIRGTLYLNSISIIFTYDRKGEIIISDEGRAVISTLFPVLLSNESSSQSIYARRYPGPFYWDNEANATWALGCLFYMILTRKEPYYQYLSEKEIGSAVDQGELPRQPNGTETDMDEIGDPAWSLIVRCCEFSSFQQPTLEEIERTIVSWDIADSRPSADTSLETSLRAMRSRTNVDFKRIETLLDQIQVDLLRSPLSKLLLHNHIKDITQATERLQRDDIRTLVDFLDLVLTDHLSKFEERNHALALLSGITSSTHIFPRHYELKGIRYNSAPMARGGYGTVHRGTDVNVCVKVMAQVDPKALTPWIRELILWAHASHPNILPFCGVLLERGNKSQQICLVSPYMKNGNLKAYAIQLSQKSRLALVLDVANGLRYLHDSGITHGDLKGENILISNEGRCLITDFGTTHITTATAAPTTSNVPTTLRYAAPEVVLESGQPTKERDIWAFGCVCYETFSRLPPYYQYASIVQVSVALSRKETPKRPGLAESKEGEEARGDDWGCDEEDDFDEIDDQAWGLITKCCTAEPGDRPGVSTVRELIIDMKVWDDRPASKAALGADLSKLRQNPTIDLYRVGKLLDEIQKIIYYMGEEGDPYVPRALPPDVGEGEISIPQEVTGSADGMNGSDKD